MAKQLLKADRDLEREIAIKNGTPHWRDAGAYSFELNPSLEDRKALFWAWEFLRRNHDYRNAWEACGPDKPKKNAVDEFGFWHSASNNKYFSECNRFGISEIIDPGTNTVSCVDIFSTVRIAPAPSLVLQHIRNDLFLKRAERIVISIDAFGDTETDLKQIRKLVDEFKAVAIPSLSQAFLPEHSPALTISKSDAITNHLINFPNYVRLLDATDQLVGISEAQVKQQFAQQEELEHEKSQFSTEIDAVQKRISRWMSLAKAIRDGRYRELTNPRL